MTGWLGLGLDALLIAVVGVGIFQAIRLIRHLQDLRASRAEMERFVRDFNSAVVRAEAGVKALRAAARESGDDLERLVERAGMIRDELTFIVESADSVADRLSGLASKGLRADQQTPAEPDAPKAAAPDQRTARKPAGVSPIASARIERASISRAEEELMQALKKMG